MSQDFSTIQIKSTESSSSDEMKKKIVETSANSVDGSQDYLSRTSLHYGEDHIGGSGFTAPSFEDAGFSEYLSQRTEFGYDFAETERPDAAQIDADTIASLPSETEHAPFQDAGTPDGFVALSGSPASPISEPDDISVPNGMHPASNVNAAFAPADHPAGASRSTSDPEEKTINEDSTATKEAETPVDPAFDEEPKIAGVSQAPLTDPNTMEVANAPTGADITETVPTLASETPLGPSISEKVHVAEDTTNGLKPPLQTEPSTEVPIDLPAEETSEIPFSAPSDELPDDTDTEVPVSISLEADDTHAETTAELPPSDEQPEAPPSSMDFEPAPAPQENPSVQIPSEISIAQSATDLSNSGSNELTREAAESDTEKPGEDVSKVDSYETEPGRVDTPQPETTDQIDDLLLNTDIQSDSLEFLSEPADPDLSTENPRVTPDPTDQQLETQIDSISNGSVTLEPPIEETADTLGSVENPNETEQLDDLSQLQTDIGAEPSPIEPLPTDVLPESELTPSPVAHKTLQENEIKESEPELEQSGLLEEVLSPTSVTVETEVEPPISVQTKIHSDQPPEVDEQQADSQPYTTGQPDASFSEPTPSETETLTPIEPDNTPNADVPEIEPAPQPDGTPGPVPENDSPETIVAPPAVPSLDAPSDTIATDPTTTPEVSEPEIVPQTTPIVETPQKVPPAPEITNQAPTSLQLEGCSIAEGAEGSVIGRLAVEDESGDSHQFSVSDDRFEIVSGEVKLKDGLSLERGTDHDLEVSVTATDEAGNEITGSFAIDVIEMPDVTIASGFKASYFDVDHSLRKLDDIDWNSAATHEEVVSDVNYANTGGSFWEGGSKDTFGAKITGNIEVEEGGTFDFHIGGDDGVALFVNGQEVIENDGLHGFRTRSGEVELEPGTHTIEVRYFENFGGAGLKLEWEGPGTDGRELVTAPDVDDLQTVNGMPIALQIETADLDGADVTQSISGLPEGTIIQSGDNLIEVDDTGTADITGLDTETLVLTPPIEFTGTIDAHLETAVSQDGGDQVVSSMDMQIDVSQADIPDPSVTVETGFKASYFDVNHSIKKLDQLDWDAEPTHQEMTQEINYTKSSNSFWEGGSRDTFGAKIEGEIMVEEGGSFDFFVGGDDGVKLFVDGVEVVDNDGLHAYKTGKGTIELEPGAHDIEVIYFENHGHAGLKLEWEGPGTNGRELVTAHGEMKVDQNGSLEIGLDDQNLSDEATIAMSGLPADTIVMCGDIVEVSDGSPIDISGWDLDMIEIAPPANFTGIMSMDVEVSDVAFNGQETSSVQTIEIPVGDVTQNDTDGTALDEITLMAENDAGEEASWLDSSALFDGADETTQDVDVLQEDIQLNDAGETSVEVFETYERQDW